MSVLTQYQKARQRVTSTYNDLSSTLARGQFLTPQQVDNWSSALDTARQYDLHAEADALVALLAKPRSDAGKSISKPGEARKQLARDAFSALFVSGGSL
jgi:hypothetical protein